jgi:hypothetical protein
MLIKLYCTNINATGVRSPTAAEDFSSTLCVQPALGPTQPPTMGIGNLPRRQMRLGRAADHLPPSGAAG